MVLPLSVILAGVCLSLLLADCQAQVDPYVAETSGRPIVEAAVVEANKALGDDKGILCRIAAVETALGEAPHTYNDPTIHGGIWGVSDAMFMATQDTMTHTELIPLHAKIQAALGIDWTTVVWADLRKPVHSAIAARLYLHTQDNVDIIPRAINRQARYWKRFYNPTGNTMFFFLVAKIKGDPHVSQPVQGSIKPLCYDVFGQPGDIFNFLDEPYVAKVNAKLMATNGKNKKAIFVDTLAVFADKFTIYVDRSSVRIDNDTYPWVERVETRQSASENVIVVIGEKQTTIELTLLEITVFKIGTHIDFGIAHVGRIDPDAEGILGDVARKARVVDMYNREINRADVAVQKNSHAFLAVTGAGAGGVTKLVKRPGCWKVPNDYAPFQAIIKENKIECITC